MSKIISNTYNTTQVLSNPATQNPATVTSTGVIDVNSTISNVAGIFGTSGFAWTVTNLGTVESIGSQSVGIQLQSGGSITNGASGSTAGYILGSARGVYINGGVGTVANFGTIRVSGTNSAGVFLTAGGTVGNFGTIRVSGTSGGSGVFLAAGGTVVNGASGATTALISGVNFGVYSNGGAPTATVVNYGTIQGTGTNSGGIHLGSGGTVTNGGSGATAALISGYRSGIGFNANASGLGTVVNYGTIRMTSTAGTAGGIGIFLGPGGVVINRGTIITAANTQGNTQGVNLGKGGSLYNTGLISSYVFGVLTGTATSPATVVNLGTILSTETGTVGGFIGEAVVLQSGGAVTNGSTASRNSLISASNGNGVSMSGGGAVTNFGTIIGTGATASNAVHIQSVAATVTNYGLIENTGTQAAIYSRAGGLVTNEAGGTIRSTKTGIHFNDTVGTTVSFGTVVNSGTIRSTGITAGAGVYFGQGGVLTNRTSGLITAYRNAVTIMGGAGTVSNLGTITGTGATADGVSLDGGRVTNGASGSTGGLISGGGGGGGGGVHVYHSAGTVFNFGTVAGTGTASDGVHLEDGGTVVNAGLIAGSFNTVEIDSYGSAHGTVINSGRIKSTGSGFGAVLFGSGVTGLVINSGTIIGTGTNANGVFLSAGGSITNGASGSTGGLITAGYQAIGVYGSAGTIMNFGTISSTKAGTSGNHGIYLGAGGTITNLGRISSAGTHGDAIKMRGTVAGALVNLGTVTGVSLGGKDSVTNGQSGGSGGLIVSYFAGIAAKASGATLVNLGTVVNFGTIESTSTAATYSGLSLGAIIGAAGTIINSGLITGLRAGIAIGNTTGLVGIVTNSGHITGSVGILINPTDTGKNTITNSGTITGTGGTAVQFGAGNDTLIVKPGAVFTGAVSGGGGTNTVIQSAAGTLKVTGFSAFETIRLANGGADSLTLTGDNFAGVSGNTITVFDGNSGNTVTASNLLSTDKIVVHAGIGADTLKGGAGNDIFYAGGKTTITGGLGANQFTFADIGTNGITDFGASSSNELVFSNAAFALGFSGAISTPTLWTASEIAGHFSKGAGTYASASAGFDYTGGKLFYSATGSSGNQHLVATLSNSPAITAASQLFFVS